MFKNLILLVVMLGLAGSASAALLTSYELSEVGDITVGTNNKDAGLTLSIVTAASAGITATEGVYVLKLDIVGETDGKVEFDHTWATSSFDMTDQTQIVADIYFATECLPMSVIGIWDSVLGWTGNWAPPTTTGEWHTVALDISSTATINQIWAYVLEGMNISATGNATIYMDNLRTVGSAGIPEPATMVLLGLGGLAVLRRNR